MRFALIDRKIDVRLNHFLIILGTVILFTIITAILFTLQMYVLPEEYREVFVGAFAMLGSILTPLFAFLLLFVAGRFFKVKQDVALCRALAAASFISYVVLYIAVLGLTVITKIWYFFPLSIISTILGSAWNAITTYLWLLIFLKPDVERLKKAAPYAAIFMIAAFLVGHFYEFFSAYPMSAYVLELGIGMVPWLAYRFLFGLVLLYFAEDIKKLGKEAYLFAGLYMGAVLFSILENSYYAVDYTQAVWPFVSNAITLVLIYLLSLMMSERKKK